MSDLKDDIRKDVDEALGATVVAADAKPADKPGDWMENVQNLANGVHFALGYAVLLTTALFTHNWHWISGVEAILVAFVLIKEYVYDLREETGETVRSSTEDALGWLAGNVICWAVLGLAHWLAVWP